MRNTIPPEKAPVKCIMVLLVQVNQKCISTGRPRPDGADLVRTTGDRPVSVRRRVGQLINARVWIVQGMPRNLLRICTILMSYMIFMNFMIFRILMIFSNFMNVMMIMIFMIFMKLFRLATFELIFAENSETNNIH